MAAKSLLSTAMFFSNSVLRFLSACYVFTKARSANEPCICLEVSSRLLNQPRCQRFELDKIYSKWHGPSSAYVGLLSRFPQALTIERQDLLLQTREPHRVAASVDG